MTYTGRLYKLYYVVARDSRRNQYRRFMVTAENQNEACATVTEDLDKDEKVVSWDHICNTPELLYREL